MSIQVSTKEFIRKYLSAINENYAAIFAGAGLSRSSGFVNWKELLTDIAEDIGLDVEKENDLIAVAQYYKNERGGRASINQLLIEHFTFGSKENINTQILSRLPIETYWTTNYDKIIENELKKVHKIVDIKARQENLSVTVLNRNAVVYKMHGDISNPSEAVLTKDDYESYNLTHSLFTTALQGDLVSKTFLFIGFSFEDPNLNSILARIRLLLSDNQRTHYCIMKKVSRDSYKTKKEFLYNQTKQELRINDLLRYSINTILVDSYDEITKILYELYTKYIVKRVFISGSAHTYGALNDATLFLTRLSKNLIEKNYHIISGFGNGVGSFVISGALDEIMTSKNMNVERYLTMRPRPSFDLNTEEGKELQAKYRQSMFINCGVVIFLFGNKIDENGNIINSPGVLEEFQMALDNKKMIIPIGSTGYAAKEIFSYVKLHIDEFVYIKKYLNILESETDHTTLIDTIINILDDIYKYENVTISNFSY